MRPVDGEVDGLEQGGLERLVGEEPQRIARHGAVVAGDALGLFPDKPLKAALLEAVDFAIDRAH